MMATMVPARVPWRLLSRSVTARSPSTHLFRAQCASTQQRYASDSITPPEATKETKPESHSSATTKEFPMMGEDPDNPDAGIRLPRAVQAAYLKPLRRYPEYGIPSCDLQMRSYNVRNIEFFADFALRAAYYLGLSAQGPVPLPRITERWTVTKAHFINKKSQENFDRRTVRRLIQIKDGHPETVQVWLAFLMKHAYYGIGMKANVYEFTGLDVGKSMDIDMGNMSESLDEVLGNFASKNNAEVSRNAEEIVESLNQGAK